MKLEYFKRYLYILEYYIFFFIIGFINLCSCTDILEKRLNIYLVTNPILFGILDGIFLWFMMKRLKKESYRLQQRVLHFLKSINNLILAILMFFLTACNIFSVMANLIIHIMLVYLFRPMTQNPEAVDGFKEYFDKYPEHMHHKFYKNTEEIKEDYDQLKKEVANEIPVLTIKEKDQKKEKNKKRMMIVIPTIIVVLVAFTFVFTTIDMFKSWNRAFYNEFEIFINNQEMDIVYNSKYEKVVIPILYTQNEEWTFASNKEKFSIDNYLSRTNKYIITIEEYQCINNDKGNNVRCSCGMEALSETRQEIISKENELVIVKDNKKVYSGKFINDITTYLPENGTYDIRIINTNKKDYMNTTIRFLLSINELAIED